MKANILIIEDESAVSLGLQVMLEELGHTVRVADNGKIGLELCEEQLPDLLITDLIMPEVDGLKVIKTIQNSSKMKSTPILVITTSPYLLDENQITGVRVIEKPLGFEDTVNAIQSTLLELRGKKVGAS